MGTVRIRQHRSNEKTATNRFINFAREYTYLNTQLFQTDAKSFNDEAKVYSMSINGYNIDIQNRSIPIMYLDWEEHDYESLILIGLKKIICDFIYYRIMKYICELRRKEGYFINKSLIDLKSSLSTFIVQNLTKKHYDENIQLPYYFLGTSDESCYDKNLSFNLFSFFNDFESHDTKERGIILNTIFESTEERSICFQLNPGNTKLIFFTVINLNDLENGTSADTLPLPDTDDNIKNGSTRITNNPPLPPYINTNIIKKFINYRFYLYSIDTFLASNGIREDDDMHKQYLDIIQNLSTEYDKIRQEFIEHVLYSPYYNNNALFLEKIHDPKFLQFEPLDAANDNEDITRKILNEIEMNNETTLIGTMDFSSFAEVRNPNNLYPICDNVMNYTDIDIFNTNYHNNQLHFSPQNEVHHSRAQHHTNEDENEEEQGVTEEKEQN